MPTTQQPLADALPGYEFLKCAARGPYQETWIARDSPGRLLRAQFVHGFSSLNEPELADSLRRLQAPEHPLVLTPLVAHRDANRVVLLWDLIEGSLFQEFVACRARSLPGI